MALIVLMCPIDGTQLGGVNENILGQFKGNAAADDHMHFIVAFDLTCLQGHRWLLASTDLALLRA